MIQGSGDILFYANKEANKHFLKSYMEVVREKRQGMNRLTK